MALAGKVVCFTGTLSMKRAVAQQLATDSGATVTATVTKATNVVVVGEGAGSKLDKAESKGIETWTETEFQQRMMREDHARRVTANKGRRIESTAGSGKFQFSLSWDELVDLDINLTTPKGKCWHGERKIAGAELDVDRIPDCDYTDFTPTTKVSVTAKPWKVKPIENIVCDRADEGNYCCRVNYYECPTEPKITDVDYTVHCRVGDEDYLHIATLKKEGNEDVVYGFKVDGSGSIVDSGRGKDGAKFAVKAPVKRPREAPVAAAPKAPAATPGKKGAKAPPASPRGKKSAGGAKGYANEVMVFTGTLSTPRRECEAKAIAAGAKVTGSVSKNTTIVVAGPGAGSKLTQAEGFGTTVLSEEEFLARLP